MNLVLVVVGGVVLGFVTTLGGLWWWIAHVPPDRRDQVSEGWRDAQIRDRRE
jgi:hypothetical protein